jgi:hypothetical protein
MLVHIRKELYSEGACSKADIHAAQKPLLHPTTLILVVKKPTDEHEQCTIVLGNKAPKILQLPEGAEINETYYDCAGGHLEEEDLDGQSLVDESVFRRGAERELSEEFLIRGCAADSKRLTYLFQLEYGPAKMPGGGMNHEISNVYAYVLPDDVQDVQNEVTLQDDYTVKGKSDPIWCKFALRVFSFDEFLEEYSRCREQFMDGAGRIAQHFITCGISHADFLQRL